MIQLKRIILGFAIALLINTTAFAQTITDYHQTFFPGYDKQGKLVIVIRTYYVDNIPYFLAVDPNTFATKSAPATEFAPRKASHDGTPGYFKLSDLEKTPYMKALLHYSYPPYIQQNYGITQAEHPVNGVFLTVDMCPSTKPFEAKFFKTLVAMANKTQYATPVAISITGLWIEGHPQEFQWLIKQEQADNLDITWINHSFSHVYYADLPLEDNFLLTPQTNFPQEVLETEKLLLEHNQTPSVFFRFPGLISNEQLVLELRKFGLISIGANAWLAKNQSAKAGSIILVHGNGNEPEGIKDVLPLLTQGDLPLLPLSQAFS